jgi:hypothetical protein
MVLGAKQVAAESAIEIHEPFGIPLRNIGLGAAKEVLVSWSFPLANAVAEVNSIAQQALIPAFFSFEHDVLSLKSESFSQTASMWSNQRNDKLDYVLPAAIEREPMMLRLPHAYTLIVSALLFFSSRQEGRASFPKIPALRVKFQYLTLPIKSIKVVSISIFKWSCWLPADRGSKRTWNPRKWHDNTALAG